MADEYGKFKASDPLKTRLKEYIPVTARSDALEAAASSFAATAEVTKSGRYCPCRALQGFYDGSLWHTSKQIIDHLDTETNRLEAVALETVMTPVTGIETVIDEVTGTDTGRGMNVTETVIEEVTMTVGIGGTTIVRGRIRQG
jgi:hypothetical protein